MTTTTKEHLTDCAGTILADAWEWATRSWAVGGDYTYEETENRKYTSFSFDLYDTEDDSITLLDADDPKWMDTMDYPRKKNKGLCQAL